MEKIYTTEIEMKEFLKNKHYFVVFPDKSTKLYKSLRDIQDEILVDSSTIPKLKSFNSCYCIAKSSGFVFFIKKFNN